MRVEDDRRKVDLAGAIRDRVISGSAREQRCWNETKTGYKTSARNVGVHKDTVLHLLKISDSGTNLAGGPDT